MRLNFYKPALSLLLMLFAIVSQAQTAYNVTQGTSFSGASSASSAFSAATAGDVILLSAGNFTGFTIDKRVTIIGSGNGASGTVFTGATPLSLTAAGGSASNRVILRNFRVNVTASPMIPLTLGCSYVTFDNIYVRHGGATGFRINDGNTTQDLQFYGCTFDGSGVLNAIAWSTISSGIDYENVGIYNSTFVNYTTASTNAVQAINGGGGNTGNEQSYINNITIKNCLFESINCKAVYFERAANFTLENCTFHNVGNGTNLTTANQGGGIDMNFVGNRLPARFTNGGNSWVNRNINIRYNTFRNVGLGSFNSGAITLKNRDDAANANRGRYVARMDNVNIIGNVMSGCGFGLRLGETGVPVAGRMSITTTGLFSHVSNVSVQMNYFENNLGNVPADRSRFDIISMAATNVNAQRNYFNSGSAPTTFDLGFGAFTGKQDRSTNLITNVTTVGGTINTGFQSISEGHIIKATADTSTGSAIAIYNGLQALTAYTNGGTASVGGAVANVSLNDAVSGGSVLKTSSAHGLSGGDRVRFHGGTVPTGAATNVTYIVTDGNLTSDEFSISTQIAVSNQSGSIFTSATHGLVAGDKIKFLTVGSYTGITAGTEYTVANVPAATTFTLTGVTPTGTGTGPVFYRSQRPLTLTANPTGTSISLLNSAAVASISAFTYEVLTSSAAHGFAADDRVIFTNTITGLTANTVAYYVEAKNLYSNDFSVSTSPSGVGSPVVIGGNGTGSAIKVTAPATTATGRRDGVFIANADHGLSAGERIFFTTNSLAGVTPNSIGYFVRNWGLSSRNFQISTSSASGAAVEPTANGTAANAIYKLIGSNLSVTARSGNTMTSNAHGLSNGDAIHFLVSTITGAIITTPFFYVRDATANTFSIAASVGGAQIALGSGTTATFARVNTTGILLNSTNNQQYVRRITFSSPHGLVAGNTFRQIAGTALGSPLATATNYSVMAAGLLDTAIALATVAAPAVPLLLTTVNVNTQWSKVLSANIALSATRKAFLLTTSTAHGFSAGDRVRMEGTTAPVGSALTQDYFVLANGLTSTTFNISATDGGAPIAVTSAGSAATIRKVLSNTAVDNTRPNRLITSSSPHGFAVGEQVKFVSGTPHGGLALETFYTVVEVPNTTNFAIANSIGSSMLAMSNGATAVAIENSVANSPAGILDYSSIGGAVNAPLRRYTVYPANTNASGQFPITYGDNVIKNGAYALDVTNHLSDKFIVATSANVYVSQHSTLDAAIAAASTGQRVICLDAQPIETITSPTINKNITIIKPGAYRSDADTTFALRLEDPSISSNFTVQGPVYLAGDVDFPGFTITIASGSELLLDVDSVNNNVGTVAGGTRSVLRLMGSAQIGSVPALSNVYNLIVDRTGGTRNRLTANATLTGGITLGDNDTLNLDIRSLTVANSTMYGTNSLLDSRNAASTFTTSATILPSLVSRFGNLVISSGGIIAPGDVLCRGNVTLNGTLKINGNMVFGWGGTITNPGNLTLPSVAPYAYLQMYDGAVYPAGLGNRTVNSLNMDGSVNLPAQIVTIYGGYVSFGKTLTFSNSGKLTINSTGSFNNQGTINTTGGTLAFYVTPIGSGTYTGTGTVELYAGANLPASITSIGNLKVDKTGTLNLSGNLSVSGTLSLNSAVAIGSNTLTLNAPFVNLGSGSVSGTSASSLILNGTATMPNGISNLNTLSVNSSTAINQPTDLTLEGSLTIGTGSTFNVNDKTLVLKGSPVITGAGTLGTTNQSTLHFAGGAYNLTGRSLLNLHVHGNNDITLTSGTVNVHNKVRLNGNANLNISGGSLVLKSSATSTGFIVKNGTGSIIGNVTMERAASNVSVNAIGVPVARHYSSPFAGKTVGDLNGGGTAADVEQWVESSNTTTGAGWTPMSSNSDPLEMGKGYMFKTNSSAVVSLTGTPNFSNTVATVTRNGANGWNLIGNPFPAQLDWDAVIEDAGFDDTKVFTGMYRWVSRSPIIGYWGGYINGIPSERTQIPSMSAILVRVKSGTPTYNLTMKYSHCDTTTNSYEFRRRGVNDTRPLIKVGIGATNSNDIDEAYVYYQAGATSAFDAKYDLEKAGGSAGMPSIYTKIGNSKAYINGLDINALASGAVIPLEVNANTTGNFNISLPQVLNMSGYEVVLTDVNVGVLHNFSANGAYQVNLSSGIHANRFFLGVVATGTSVANSLKPTLSVYPNPSANGEINISGVNLSEGRLNVTLLNTLGAILEQAELVSGNGIAKHSFNTKGLSKGVYLVQIKGAGINKVEKVVVD